MADPFLSIGPITLTDEQRRRAAAGEAKPFFTMQNDPLTSVQNFGNALQQPNPDLSPFLNLLKSGVGHAMSDPLDIVDEGIDLVAPSLANAGDALFKTQKEIDIERDSKLVGDNVRRSAEVDRAAIKKAEQTGNVLDALGTLEGETGGAVIGPAESANVGALQLPPLPPQADFSGVQDAIDQTRPDRS